MSLQPEQECPRLAHLLDVTEVMANLHSVPQEAVLLHALACGSALAGDLIRSKPPGAPDIPARFRLLISTPDAMLPPWIAEEWQYLGNRQKAPPDPLSDPARIGEMRNTVHLANHDNGIAFSGGGFDALLADRELGPPLLFDTSLSASSATAAGFGIADVLPHPREYGCSGLRG